MLKKLIITCFLLLSLIGCGSGSSSGIFDSPILIAIDSTNNRVFIFEKEGNLFIFTASDFEDIGEDQPVVNDERNTTIHSLLPTTATDMVVETIGGTSRLFIIGVQTNSGGINVSNQVLVLDFDGTTISEASFSPIIVDDGDGSTEESDNIMGGLQVDAANSRLYVTDSTGGMLYIFSVNDGTQTAGPLAIAGTPNKMSLDAGRLYVANNTSTDADQVITVVKVDDLTTTSIDIDNPTSDISVISNDNGTVMIVKVFAEQIVKVLKIDTGTFASASSIAAGDSSVADGQISSGFGVSSSIGRILLTKDSAGAVFGYVPQADGNIELLTILSSLASFTGQSLSTAAEIYDGIDVFLDSSGNGITVYAAAGGSGDILFTDVGTTEVNGRFLTSSD